MSKQMLARPLSREQLYQLRDGIRRVQEPFIQLLVDLYSVSLPKITIADGIVETTYSPDIEKQAAQIRNELVKAVETITRYKPEPIPLPHISSSGEDQSGVDFAITFTKRFSFTRWRGNYEEP